MRCKLRQTCSIDRIMIYRVSQKKCDSYICWILCYCYSLIDFIDFLSSGMQIFGNINYFSMSLVILYFWFLLNVHRFLMRNKPTFLSCLIFRLWTLECLSHMQRFIMSNKVTFLSCLIFTLLTLEVVSYMMCKFLIPDKFTFVTSLIFTFRTLEYLSHMYRYLMSNKVTFLSCLMFTLWTLEFLTYMHRF